jgi:hypothetical protein
MSNTLCSAAQHLQRAQELRTANPSSRAAALHALLAELIPESPLADQYRERLEESAKELPASSR